MDMERSQLSGGSLQISTEVLAKIARLAALEVSGIAQVTSDVPKHLAKTNLQRPVTVVMKDGIAEVTIRLYVKYDCAVRTACAKVQENVKNTIQNMTGITVSKVNVIVAGLGEEANNEE